MYGFDPLLTVENTELMQALGIDAERIILSNFSHEVRAGPVKMN